LTRMDQLFPDSCADSQAPYELLSPELTEADHERFRALTCTTLTPHQLEQLVTPPTVCRDQKSVLAVHWHPESVPLEIALQRIQATFPNCERSLIIPTDHNILRTLNGYAGVEVDCYSPGFQRKIHLLIHMRDTRLAKAGAFTAMLKHTFEYRSQQLLEIVDTIVGPTSNFRFQRAVSLTGVDDTLVRFVRVNTQKFRELLDYYRQEIPAEVVKNRLLRDYFDSLVVSSGRRIVELSQVMIREVKNTVKAGYKLEYFYRTSDIIEEARSLGAGIVVPHPEQFWPVLLAEYDVDGYEVWNPQSRQYTDFLINVVTRQNKTARRGHRPILLFMGDDTHLGEKTRDAFIQDLAKTTREIGVQPAWDDLVIRKSLMAANADRDTLIAEYTARLE
jgi:hypothetical protein